MVEQLVLWLHDQYDHYFMEFRKFTLRDFLADPFRVAGRFVSVVNAVILAVEAKAKELGGVPGDLKKEAAIQYLNDKIDIKLIFMDEKREAVVFGWLVDFCVLWMNKVMTHTWAQDTLERAQAIFIEVKSWMDENED